MMALSVLSVIGIVLKWILFVILGIIGLVLLIVLIVLFDPFFYKLKGNKKDKQIEAHARVFYLFHLVRVEVDFVDKKLVWKVKVAWKQIAGSDMVSEKDDESYRQHGDLEIESADGESISGLQAGEELGEREALPAPENKPKSEEAQLLSTLTEEWKERIRMAEDETYAREQREKAKEQKQREKAEKVAEKQRKKDAAAKEKLKAEREKEAARKAALADGESGEANLSDRIDAGIGKLLDLYEKIWDIVDAILDAPDKIEETLEEKLGPIEKYMRIYDRYPRKSETLNAVFKLLGDILRHLVPKRYQIYLHFGSGDPFGTAKLIGIWYAVAPTVFPKQTRTRRIEIDTEMEEKILDFDADLRGRFSIASLLLGPIIVALCNRDIRRLIRFALKLKKKKDAEAKKAEEAAAKAAEEAGKAESADEEAARVFLDEPRKAEEPAAIAVNEKETVEQTEK